MLIVNSPVKEIKEIQKDIFLQKIYSPEIARQIKPGQFLNIRVSETVSPLLRRPFSICDVDEDYIYLMFNIFGEGTRILSHKHIDDTIDILGPLGNGFNFTNDFDTAIIVAGGLGSAPFPFLTRLLKDKFDIYSFVGGRSKNDVITYNLLNVQTATDDGSLGFNGNVVQLFEKNLPSFKSKRIKVFGCGPNAMLRALKEVCIAHNINCEVSTECAMACGFGICQGCPIESTEQSDKYLLVCKDGPVFNVKDVKI
ncbi:dihydroorotate dehydrogenase electron transfer subunit [Ignavibacterium sp.]|uniref:dihydroorotate dehydrogenase electron transfer subunit n=1 Tax=Ignavibacterium sp. TaxID=2651167 RepID=UPI002206B772|nr:dihydroorotate dehydrogenase electron transfer subunit [Ignavibacterium sp.]BDQ01967.1 MAG: dihydroorotate oxidase [Ignavibacterium sp.]